MKLRYSAILVALCLVSSVATASNICWVERVTKIEGGIRVFVRPGYEWAVRGLNQRNTDGYWDLKEGEKIFLSTIPHDSCVGTVVKKEEALGLELSASSCMLGDGCVHATAFVRDENDAYNIEESAKINNTGLRKELEELGGSRCSASEVETPAESFFRRGKLLNALNEYSSAMHCFLLAQDRGRNTAVYRDACSAIGTMYELGWGVEKNMATARSWYKRAGL